MQKIAIKYIDTSSYTVTIRPDEYSESPLDWTTPDERGTWFVMYHRHYDVPNELDHAGVEFEDYTSWTNLAEAVTADDTYGLKDKPFKFVRWHEHSGVAVSLRDDESGNDWDAGIVGVIIGDDNNAIKASFTDWKNYIEGNIFDVTIEENGNFLEGSCGLFGDEAVQEYINEIIPDAVNVEVKQ